jgi:KDO2-lipid IV(A) lauroyltransferase
LVLERGQVLGLLRNTFASDSLFWRRALYAGVQHGPDAWVRYSPPVFGVAFGAALAAPRRNVQKMLRRIHGPRPAHRELKEVAEVFANFAWSMTDALLLGAGRGYHVINRPIGDWYMLSSYARGQGVIAATAQTAGWDLGAKMLDEVQPDQVLIVMEPEPNRMARELHDSARRRAGYRVLHVSAGDPLASLAALRHLTVNRGILALKFDRVVPGMRTREVTFCGEPWRIPEGPLRLAALSGAPIVPVLTRRLGFLEYQTINSPPIRVSRRPSQAELDDAAQQLAGSLEAFVKEHPAHWFRFTED